MKKWTFIFITASIKGDYFDIQVEATSPGEAFMYAVDACRQYAQENQVNAPVIRCIGMFEGHIDNLYMGHEQEICKYMEKVGENPVEFPEQAGVFSPAKKSPLPN